jgi:hypothetical protein
MSEPVSYPVFFHLWAEYQGWDVPDFHYTMADWLENRGDLGVLKVFRGAAKSTHLAVYNAWRYYRNPQYRILHQGDQDGTAYKTARDTKHVIQRHPLTRHMGETEGEVSFWWVPGATDQRNPSMQAAGILSNITSSRADEIQNDDVEVPRNIATPEAREKLRYRLGEQIHILVPGGRRLFVGTPHTHDSIYDEQGRLGADVLRIPLFQHEHRIENATRARYKLPFRPEYVFAGIGEFAALLKPGLDYRVEGNELVFAKPPARVVDCYAGCAWPERFTPEEMAKRRRQCRTLNEWDSQYQLHSKPVSEVRLNPDRIIRYAVEPEIRRANGAVSMWLGKARIAGMACRWDPSSGKLKSDVSAVAMVLQDEHGCRYLHRTPRLTGDVAEFAEDGKTITGGQVWQLCDLIEQYAVPRVVVETNGIGAFAPAVLKACLKQRKLLCGVKEEQAVINKNRRILEAYEGILTSNMLWAHAEVLDGPFFDQLRDFNPAEKDQKDDYIDAGAGAITDTPERLRAVPDRTLAERGGGDWRPDGGVHEVEVEF